MRRCLNEHTSVCLVATGKRSKLLSQELVIYISSVIGLEVALIYF